MIKRWQTLSASKVECKRADHFRRQYCFWCLLETWVKMILVLVGCDGSQIIIFRISYPLWSFLWKRSFTESVSVMARCPLRNIMILVHRLTVKRMDNKADDLTQISEWILRSSCCWVWYASHWCRELWYAGSRLVQYFSKKTGPVHGPRAPVDSPNSSFHYFFQRNAETINRSKLWVLLSYWW